MGMPCQEEECKQEQEDFPRDHREEDFQLDFHKEDFHQDREHQEDFHQYHKEEDQEEQDRPDHHLNGGYHHPHGRQARLAA